MQITLGLLKPMLICFHTDAAFIVVDGAVTFVTDRYRYGDDSSAATFVDLAAADRSLFSLSHQEIDIQN